MNELIAAEIRSIQEQIQRRTNQSISEEMTFNHVLLQYVFGVDSVDQDDLITDGPNDGGIDFLYYDEDEAKVILCQSKYTQSLTFNSIIAELDKMYSTLKNFRNTNTGMYNGKLRKALQNILDRLPGQSRILCKHRKGANRAEFQRERREAVPFGVILAAKAPHVKIPPAQSGIRSAKYTPNWAWITLQSCRLPVHFWVMSIIAR